jgi:hypothetical protein
VCSLSIKCIASVSEGITVPHSVLHPPLNTTLTGFFTVVVSLPLFSNCGLVTLEQQKVLAKSNVQKLAEHLQDNGIVPGEKTEQDGQSNSHLVV